MLTPVSLIRPRCDRRESKFLAEAVIVRSIASLAKLAALMLAVAAGPARGAYFVETIAVDGTSLLVGSGAISGTDDAQISMNDSGIVAFAGFHDGGKSSIYIGSGGALTTITTVTPTNLAQADVGQPVINAAGKLAWLQYVQPVSSVRTGISTSIGGPGTEVAVTSGSGFSSLDNVSIASDGRVTFYGGLGVSAGGIYALGPGDTTLTVIATSTGPYGDLAGFFDLIRAPHSVSRAGTAIFHAYFNAVSQFDLGDQGIFTGAGGSPVKVVDDVGTFASVSDAVAINDSGAVAFVGSTVAPDVATGATDGIFFRAAGAASPALLVPATAAGLNNFNSLCLANNGALSFSAREGSGGHAIFVRSAAGAIERVIGDGDPLAGKTVGRAYASRTGLNESGQVAFYVYFSGGSSGVFRATISGPGTLPDAVDDLLTIRGAGKLDVLANDTPPTGGTLKITAVSAPAKGKATISAGTMITYTPGKTFDGTDTFTYTVTSNGFTDTASVTVTNPFLALHGSFTQLVTAGGANVGTLAATLTPGGALTGKLIVGGKTYALKGTVGFDGGFTQTFIRKPAGTADLVVTLAFAVDNGVATISGSATGDAVPYSIASGAVSLTILPSGVESGAYTVLLPPDAAVTNPRGIGWATAKLATTGKLTLAGRLADGTPFSATAVLGADSTADVFAPLYSKPKGDLAGTLTFATSPSRFTGSLAWRKPKQDKPGGLFQDGFSATTTASGARFIATKNVRTLTYTDTTTSKADVQVRGGGISDIDAVVTVTLGDKATDDSQLANLVKLSISRTSGMVSGSFLPTGAFKALSFSGVAQQGENRAAGFFEGADQTGTITLAPR